MVALEKLGGLWGEGWESIGRAAARAGGSISPRLCPHEGGFSAVTSFRRHVPRRVLLLLLLLPLP